MVIVGIILATTAIVAGLFYAVFHAVFWQPHIIEAFFSIVCGGVLAAAWSWFSNHCLWMKKTLQHRKLQHKHQH
jgi:flagellar motor component MotA